MLFLQCTAFQIYRMEARRYSFSRKLTYRKLHLTSAFNILTNLASSYFPNSNLEVICCWLKLISCSSTNLSYFKMNYLLNESPMKCLDAKIATKFPSLLELQSLRPLHRSHRICFSGFSVTFLWSFQRYQIFSYSWLRNFGDWPPWEPPFCDVDEVTALLYSDSWCMDPKRVRETKIATSWNMTTLSKNQGLISHPNSKTWKSDSVKNVSFSLWFFKTYLHSHYF